MANSDRLLALLLAPDVERERKRANEKFARRPPQSLEEELAWQREVQLRAEADQVRAAIRSRKAGGKRLDNEILREAFRQAVKILGRRYLASFLGKPLNPRKRKFTPQEARVLRDFLLQVDSPFHWTILYDGDAT